MPFITVAAVLLYASAAYFLLLMPKIGPLLKGGSLDPTILQAQLDERLAYREKLRAAVAAYKAVNDERKQRLEAAIPDTPDVPGIFVQLDAIAKENEFVLVSADTVVDERASSPAGKRTISISANLAGGDYKEFKALLDSFARSLRLFDVTAAVFTPNTGNYSLAVRAYYYPAEPAR